VPRLPCGRDLAVAGACGSSGGLTKMSQECPGPADRDKNVERRRRVSGFGDRDPGTGPGAVLDSDNCPTRYQI
jgi:hypothetical protein